LTRALHDARLAFARIRYVTSAYVSIRQHTSAYVSIRQHTTAYVKRQRLALSCGNGFCGVRAGYGDHAGSAAGVCVSK
jgi:hypothetical protein